MPYPWSVIIGLLLIALGCFVFYRNSVKPTTPKFNMMDNGFVAGLWLILLGIACFSSHLPG